MIRAGAMTAAILLATVAGGRAGERIDVTGELIDSWCYFSGVMGGPEATVGTAHHACAMWCAAGGIPVGLRTDDGTVYMVLKLEGRATARPDASLLRMQSHRIRAVGEVYRRDGISYIVVGKVIADEGITNHNHTDYGTVPGFVIPELN